jgi:alpha-beta hydrolase superfamily lysophospholipase
VSSAVGYQSAASSRNTAPRAFDFDRTVLIFLRRANYRAHSMHQESICFRNFRFDSLSGVLHYPAGAVHSAVILCHGMESSKDSEKLVYMAEALAQRGILALRFDFACAGESSGHFENLTYSGEVDDIHAAYDLVQSRHPGKTAIFGSSMGGTVALLYAGNQPSICGVATLAAPVHPERFPARLLTSAEIEQWRRRGYVFYNGKRLNVSLLDDLEKIDVCQAAARIRCPLLIVHGDADEVVPVAEARELYDLVRADKQLMIVKGGDHRLSSPADMQSVLAKTLDWLTDRVQ